MSATTTETIIEVEFRGATPLPIGREVGAFSDFPMWKQLEIQTAVFQDSPPPKWISLGLAEIVSRAWYEWHWHRGIDPDAKRPKIPPRMRRYVMERDGLVCGICGGDVEPSDVHIDHIVPWSRGGKGVASNLQVSHSQCNLKKGAQH